MKVLIVHNHYRYRGGEDLCFEADTELLRQHGHQVVHYTRHNDDVGSRSKFAEARQTLWNRETYDQVRTLIDRESPDVMHVHNTFPLISPSVYDAAYDQGVPVVQALHNYRPICIGAALLRDGRVCESCVTSKIGIQGIRHRCYRNSLAASAASALLNLRNRQRKVWHRRVDRFIAFSTSAREFFVRAGFPADRIELNPHFVELHRGPQENRHKAFMFVGRLVPEKGIDRLLKAWEKYQGEWQLRIAGEGPLESSVREAAAKDPRIQFYGVLPRNEMIDRLAESSCLVFPSPWHETFGRVLIEAFALGLPVLAAKLGGPLDIVEPGVTGDVFDPDQIDQITEAMQRFADGNSEQSSETLAQRSAAFKAYQERYTSPVNYRRLMQIYHAAQVQRAVGAVSPLGVEA